MRNEKAQAITELDKFIEACRKTIKLWIICTVITVIILIIIASIANGGGSAGAIWALVPFLGVAFFHLLLAFFTTLKYDFL